MAWINYFHPLRKLQRERAVLADLPQLPSYIQKNLGMEYPHLNDEAKELEYICLDLETTGLDPEKDRILSIGWVVIKGLHIDISSGKQLMIKDNCDVCAQTAVINHITPEMLEQGYSLSEAFKEFFVQSQGRVIVAHACFVEKHFIDHYLKRCLDLPELPFLWLDTLGIEKHFCQNIDNDSEADLRLSSVRERYGLPEYNAHGALIDSIATAELLLAQIKRVYKDGKSCFGRLYRISHTRKR